MPGPPYPMNHHAPQQAPYGMPPQAYHQSMPPSVSMPLTVAALSGSSPATGSPYYSQQQPHPMMHQQHMMMMQHQQQQFQQQQQQQQQQSKQPMSNADTSLGITTGVQCDFCTGDEHENKTTKLPEQMITCKVY